jgi:hypothetical protein
MITIYTICNECNEYNTIQYHKQFIKWLQQYIKAIKCIKNYDSNSKQ